jgi:hypothetical protein
MQDTNAFDPLRAHRPRSTRTRMRTKIDRYFPWLFLAYGVAAVGVEASFTGDEIVIATGLETIILALVDFLWAGELLSLSIALRGVAVLSPLLLWGASPLFYRDTSIGSDAFIHSMALGAVAAVPLFLLGTLALRVGRRGDIAEESRAMRVLRWAFRGGLLLVVLAMRLGQWSTEGIALVYVGAALAIAAIVIVLTRRVRIGALGVGFVLLVLGVGALLIIGAAKFLIGGHMSDEEAAIGAVPAAIVAVVGAVVMLARRRPLVVSR